MAKLTSYAMPWTIIAMIAVINLYTNVELLEYFGVQDAFSMANTVGPIIVILSTGLSAFFVAKRYPIALWTPYEWFYIQSALFFGLGPLVYIFGNASTISYLSHSMLWVNEYELMRTNLLNAVGILTVLISFYFTSRLKLVRKVVFTIFKNYQSKFNINILAIIFLSLGFLLRYTVFLPYQFGLVSFELPGFIVNMHHMILIGIMLAAYLSAKGNKVWRIVFWLFFTFQLATSLLEFTKSSLMLSIMFPVLGAYFANHRISRLILWATLMLIVFYLVQPLVNYGRNQIFQDTETITQASLGQRLNILNDYLTNWDKSPSAVWETEVQLAWTRLAYSGPQAFAMQQYDRGQPGNTLKNIWIVFIPRFLWPEKPGIGPGQDFYELVTGNYGTFLGLSVYGNGYWEFGWPGVIALSFFMGFIFTFLSEFSLKWMKNLAFIYMPCVFLGIQMAILGPTKFFINGILGGLVMYIAYMLLVRVITLLKSSRHGSLKTYLSLKI